jgi:uncharacterized LabA/DUF88 family protein
MTPPDTRSMALFCDFENVALGVRESRYDRFDISKILERLLLKGSILVKKAYCDWERYKEFKADMHQASFELIEIPHVRQSGKNSADIRMVVDALDLCYTKGHVDTFVIISGDSDFSPLVSKLRENAKIVIGVGVKNSTSDLLIGACDEFIFYDDLVVRGEQTRHRPVSKKRGDSRRSGQGAKTPSESVAMTAGGGVATPHPASPHSATGPAVAHPVVAAVDREAEENKIDAFELVVDTLDALVEERGEGDRIWGSMVKQTLKRRHPGFNEAAYGFRSFNRLLEEARDRGWLDLELDEKSGGYVVRSIEAE